jgi:tryptophanyl-tRNA synthetase
VLQRDALSILLGMVAKYSELIRNPTLKEELERQSSATAGFMYYPVDQAADIYMISPTPPQDGDELLVPVGKDQESHLEFAREIARDFNRQYGPTFVPCSALIGEIGTLVGTDGSGKMSKSQGNAINLSDDARTVQTLVRGMFTDPNRIRADIPGETENNPVFIYHRAFNPDTAEVADLEDRYRSGRVGDVEVKQKLATALNSFLDPMRERRAAYENVDIREIVVDGTEAAQASCQQVIDRVRDLMYLRYPD